MSGVKGRHLWAGTARALVLCLFVACDPGGSYRVPGGTIVTDNGARAFELVGASNTTLRARASWFTSSMNIYLSIANKGSTSLLIRPNQFHLADRKETLPLYPGRRVPHCEGHDQEELVTLAPGDTCWMFADFEVQPDRDRLRTLMLIHEGVTRDGVAVPVSVKFDLE